VTSPFHGWLAAVVPAGARTFRVDDPALEITLRDAGADLVAANPDVEIASPAHASDDASHVIVTVDAGQGEGGGRFVRAVRRLRGSLHARLLAARVRRAVERRGYGATSVVLWDLEQLIYLPRRPHDRGRRFAERLPQRALVVGSRSEHAETILDSVVNEVANRLGDRVEYGLPLARVGLTLVIADDYVVRVAVGSGRRKLELQRDALQLLRAAEPGPSVGDRVPWLEASGRLGLADWSVERRLPGETTASLAAGVLADSVDFLVALHATRAGSTLVPLTREAKILATVCDDERAKVVTEVALRLDSRLADLPRGFGHGDFWTRNLLVEEGRLTGVIDWDAATPDRLPLLDLLHLHLSAHRERTREYLGPALLRYLLPWARSGGDDTVLLYCRRLGLDVDASVLEDLAIAYWLTRVAFEVSLFADRAERPIWMQNNVESVLDAIAMEKRPI